MRVEPIRDKQMIYRIEDRLFSIKTAHGARMFLMFETGIYLGMRIGDMLQMRVGDIRGKEVFTFTPQKTDERHKDGEPVKGYRPKVLTYTIPPTYRNVVTQMCAGMADKDWLFPSKKHLPTGEVRPITRQAALMDMREIKRISGIDYPIGCHTLRKTFGYHVYQKYHDIAWLQSWFGHSSAAITLVYIGIAEDEKKNVTNRMPYEDRGRFDWSQACSPMYHT